MSARTITRHGFGLAIASLLAGIVLVASFLLVVAVPDLARTAAAPTPSALPGATASPSPTPRSAMALSPIGIEMPADSDCAACHVTTTGTLGTRPIPPLAHPLWGWRDCTACHAPDRLVRTAPGHSGLHKDDCLVCHQVPDTATPSQAPLRREHMGNTQPCTSCHGQDKHAPLPEAMQGRDNCWICHNGPEFTYLFESPSAPPPAAPTATPSTAPADG